MRCGTLTIKRNLRISQIQLHTFKGAEELTSQANKQARMPATETTCNVCGGAAVSQCAKCKTTCYCSTECQKIDWKAHKKLCGKPSIVDEKDGYGWTALFKAARDGNIELVNALLIRKASVDVQETEYGTTALYVASLDGHLEVANALLMHHASVDVQQKDGATALYIASQKGHLEVVNALLMHQASVDLQAKDGRTALYLASQKGHLEVVNALLMHHASVDVQDKGGRTALMAASYQGHLAVFRVLLLSGADIDIKDKKGKDALTLAREEGHLGIVDLIEREQRWRRRKPWVMFWSGYSKAPETARSPVPAIDKALSLECVARAIAGYVI
jgi:ankyrin repeat protein